MNEISLALRELDIQVTTSGACTGPLSVPRKLFRVRDLSLRSHHHLSALYLLVSFLLLFDLPASALGPTDVTGGLPAAAGPIFHLSRAKPVVDLRRGRGRG